MVFVSGVSSLDPINQPLTQNILQSQLFSPSHIDKANIYTWLAWQRPPGQPFPYALKDKILEPTQADVQTFVTWFKTLYGL